MNEEAEQLQLNTLRRLVGSHTKCTNTHTHQQYEHLRVSLQDMREKAAVKPWQRLLAIASPHNLMSYKYPPFHLQITTNPRQATGPLGTQGERHGDTQRNRARDGRGLERERDAVVVGRV